MTDTLETYYSAGGPFIPPALLHTWPARVAGGGDRRCGIVPCKLRLVMGARTATKPGEAGASRHEHNVLVVLQ